MRGSLVNFPPKFHCDQGGAQKRRLAFKRHRIEHILPPRALMTLIIGAPCSLQPRLSDHLWVHLSNSCQNPGVAGGVPENGEFTIKHHRIENILTPRAPMALIIGSEHIELPAKLLDYFLRSNKSNIDQSCTLQLSIWAFWVYVGLHG